MRPRLIKGYLEVIEVLSQDRNNLATNMIKF